MTVQELADLLIANPERKVTIKGVEKKIIGFAEFASINYGEDEPYFKITFHDHTSLCLIPTQETILYSHEPSKHFTEIPDEDIEHKKEIEFRGKTYKLDNPGDYQYVLRLIVGDWTTIEGEAKFSDYVPVDGSNELLSLGWITMTKKRADVYAKGLDISEIKVA